MAALDDNLNQPAAGSPPSSPSGEDLSPLSPPSPPDQSSPQAPSESQPTPQEELEALLNEEKIEPETPSSAPPVSNEDRLSQKPSPEPIPESSPEPESPAPPPAPPAKETPAPKPPSLEPTPEPAPPPEQLSPEPAPETPTDDTLPSPPMTYTPSRGSSFKKFLKPLLIILLLGALAAAGFFLLPRFLTPGTLTLTEGELTYWGLWEDEGIMAEVIRDWEAEHPKVKVKYLRQSKEQYRERLQSALARNEGPDIFRFHNTWLPMLKEELAPLPASVMSAAEFQETFYPVASSDLRIGAAIYGLPLEIDTLALFYNEDLLRAAGKNPPENWLEFRQLASQLTVRDENNQIQIAGAAIGGTGNIDHWSDILGLMMLQNGVRLENPKGSLAEDTLTFYSYFSTRDQVWETKFPNSTQSFAGGKLALYFGFSWDVLEIQRMNPDLKFGIVPVPQLPERKPVAWASYWVEGVSQKSPLQKQAWEFLKYLTSQEVLRKLYQAQSATRLFGEPYSRQDLASELINDPLVAPFVKQAPYAKSWYLCSRTFDNGLNELMINYFADAVNAVNQKAAVGRALETTAQGVQQTLARYQISR